MQLLTRPLEAAGSDIGGGMPVGRDSQLVLPNVSYHQQGSYRCTAANNIAGRERWHAADPISLVVVRKIMHFADFIEKQAWSIRFILNYYTTLTF